MTENNPNLPSAEETLSKICDAFHIGILARCESTILTNVLNSLRRSQNLSIVERVFNKDNDCEDEGDAIFSRPALLWGASFEQFEAQFSAVLKNGANESLTAARAEWETGEADRVAALQHEWAANETANLIAARREGRVDGLREAYEVLESACSRKMARQAIYERMENDDAVRDMQKDIEDARISMRAITALITNSQEET